MVPHKAPGKRATALALGVSAGVSVVTPSRPVFTIIPLLERGNGTYDLPQIISIAAGLLTNAPVLAKFKKVPVS